METMTVNAIIKKIWNDDNWKIIAILHDSKHFDYMVENVRTGEGDLINKMDITRIVQ